ncbi:MAG: hypothetical protein V4614_13300 [Pseudomonadota bacterium]
MAAVAVSAITSATATGFEAAASGGYLAQLSSWDVVSHPCRYWPCELLSAFMLQMAAKGCSVNESMMLGSHDYAIEKLSHAHTLNDDALRELAVRMFSYFDDEPVHAVAQLVGSAGAQLQH